MEWLQIGEKQHQHADNMRSSTVDFVFVPFPLPPCLLFPNFPILNVCFPTGEKYTALRALTRKPKDCGFLVDPQTWWPLCRPRIGSHKPKLVSWRQENYKIFVRSAFGHEGTDQSFNITKQHQHQQSRPLSTGRVNRWNWFSIGLQSFVEYMA